MPIPANTAGNGTRPSGATKTHNTRASTRASSQTSSQPQPQPKQPDPPRQAQLPDANSQQASASNREGTPEKVIVVRKEILASIVNRLDQIIEKCKTTEHFKKTIASLARYTWNAAEQDQGTVIQLTIEDLKSVQDDVKADLSKWCDSIDDKLDKLGNKQNEILEATANFNERASGLQTVAKEIENQVGKVTTATDKIVSNATPYRDALLGDPEKAAQGVAAERVLVDMERKAKQIMIIIKDFDTATMTIDKLVDKANGIIVKIQDKDRPDSVKIESITRFPNGSMLLHLNSKEAVKWLREPSIEDAFLKKLDKDAYVKERPYNVLLRGVPIIFNPGNQSHLREVEEINGLTKYSILKAKWIKPENRRRKGQTHAHVTASIGVVETANSIIKGGLEICGTRIKPEKLRQEPLQCLRCRRWGHFAANCPEPDDTCGTCGEAHRTTLCENPDKKHCVSCNTDTHTSWDRNCPEFTRRCKNFDNMHPENNMVYFPTDERWTLTSRPDRIPLEERFPQRFAVNSLPLTNKRPPAKGKKAAPTKPITRKNQHGKEQNTINHYFSRSQAKGKEKESAPEEGELREDSDDYDDCFDNIENNDVERLIGSIPI
jgi:hypothetical protein